MAHPYRPLIDTTAADLGLDPDLIEAVSWIESSGNFAAYRYEPLFFRQYLATNPSYGDRRPQEVSASYGLMQILYTTAVEMGFAGHPWELFAPGTSLLYGAKYLKQLLHWSGALDDPTSDLKLRSALAAYNGGKHGNEPDGRPDRNAAYADRVMQRLATVRTSRLGSTTETHDA